MFFIDELYQGRNNEMKREIIVFIIALSIIIAIWILYLNSDKQINGPAPMKSIRDIRTEMRTLENYLGVHCAWDANDSPAVYKCQDACEWRFPRNIGGAPIIYEGGHPCDKGGNHAKN